MWSKKTTISKPTINEFNLNQADLVIGSIQRTTSTATFDSSNKHTDLYSYIINNMATSQGQPNL